MRNTRFIVLTIMAIFALILASCGGMAEEVTPSLSVSDQDATDGTVVVDSVTAAQAGWMVIHADDNGSPGPVIGHSAVEEGETSDVSVDIDLDAATETLYAMLHVDAGTMGTYEFPGDDTPVQVDGSIVVMPFTVTLPMAEVTPSLSVSDQDATDGTVVVDSVTAAQAGWMVIHADDNGSPGPVIGHSAVEEGQTSDVSVDIDLDAASETLYAMLHVDAGTMGTYEFPGDDTPVQVDGSIVVMPFTVTLPETGMDGETQEEVTVMVVDSSYEDAIIIVDVGTTVVWEVNATLPHTVTAEDGSFDSGMLNDGDTFSYTFTEPGEYPYYCTFHGAPGGFGMSGTVTVNE